MNHTHLAKSPLLECYQLGCNMHNNPAPSRHTHAKKKDLPPKANPIYFQNIQGSACGIIPCLMTIGSACEGFSIKYANTH